MNSGKNNKLLLGSGILLAATSSLCCIMPLLAVVSSATGAVAVLGWVAPLRPYLLGTTAVVLGFAFYQAYRPQPKDACGCEGKEKGNVLQTKTFLWIIATLSVLLSAFPYYAQYFQYGTPKRQVVIGKSGSTQQTVLHIQGLSCEACEGHVNNALLQKKGVQYVKTSYAKGIAVVRYDSTQISLEQLAAAIENETVYKVIP